MSRTRILITLCIFVLVLSCKRATETTVTSTQSSSTQSTVAVPAPVPQTQTAIPVPAPTSAAAPASTAALASEETKWKGVTATVTEFRRRGNTLTAKVRFANTGTEEQEPDVMYAEVYLLDTTNGKKYQVLKDEKDAYIAATRQGWTYRWYDKIQPGQAATIWMKFPAPPPEVKAISLQLTGMPPFEELAIQE